MKHIKAVAGYILILSLCLVCAHPAHAETRRIALIHSFEPGYPPAAKALELLQKEFSLLGLDCDVREYYLDCDRYMEEAENLRMAGFVDALSAWGAELIAVLDDQAAYALMACRHPLAHEIPVVFSGVNYPNISLLLQYPNITGYADTPDYLRTIRMIESIMGKSRICLMNGQVFLDRKIWHAFSRDEEIEYLRSNGFVADFTKMKYSYNVGIWGTSICGGEILDSKQGLPDSAYLKQVEKDGKEEMRIEFKHGEIVAVNGKAFDNKIEAIRYIESIAAPYGIGRDMHVGDTIIGIKGRVGFEAAAPMVIINAHKFLEKYTLSKWQQYWKDQVANWYGMFLHESQYLEPVMRDIEAMLESSQRNVNGTVIVELRPLSMFMVGVDSPDDLVKTKFGEYGEMQKGWTADDAKGFIKVLSTPLRVYYANHKDEQI